MNHRIALPLFAAAFAVAGTSLGAMEAYVPADADNSDLVVVCVDDDGYHAYYRDRTYHIGLRSGSLEELFSRASGDRDSASYQVTILNEYELGGECPGSGNELQY